MGVGAAVGLAGRIVGSSAGEAAVGTVVAGGAAAAVGGRGRVGAEA